MRIRSSLKATFPLSTWSVTRSKTKKKRGRKVKNFATRPTWTKSTLNKEERNTNPKRTKEPTKHTSWAKPKTGNYSKSLLSSWKGCWKAKVSSCSSYTQATPITTILCCEKRKSSKIYSLLTQIPFIPIYPLNYFWKLSWIIFSTVKLFKKLMI